MRLRLVEIPTTSREGSHWVNDASENSKASIHLDIHSGIGPIRLIVDCRTRICGHGSHFGAV